MSGHTHGTGIRLEPHQERILGEGLARIIESVGQFSEPVPMPSERYPIPVAAAIYGQATPASNIIADLKERLDDPVSVLEQVLVLMEIYETNQAGSADLFPEDMLFVRQVFSTKRQNGWCHLIGGDRESRSRTADSIRDRWAFTVFARRRRFVSTN